MNGPAESHSKSYCERDDPDGVEITAEMVEAGRRELESRVWFSGTDGEFTAINVYRAMEAARLSSTRLLKRVRS